MNGRRRSLFVLAALTAIGVAGALMAVGSGAQEPGPKKIPTRPAYPSDEARATAELGVYLGQDSRQKEDSFREEFIRSGGQLSTLPNADIRTQYVGPSSLQDAVRHAVHGVVVATVTSQQLVPGYVISAVRVEEPLAGQPPSQALIRQVGGPAQEDHGPVAVQVDSDPLLRLGERYVLFLGDCTPSEPVPEPTALCVGGRNGSQFTLDSSDRLHAWIDEGVWVAAWDARDLASLREAVAAPQP